MDAFMTLLKSPLFKAFIIVCAIYFAPFMNTFASSQGCCSKHQGIANCNTATGYLMCKDGTQSPSCKCNGTTMPAQKATTMTTMTPVATPTMTTPKLRGNKGCCKGHGGVKSCETRSKYLMCKDGTLSSSCKCQ